MPQPPITRLILGALVILFAFPLTGQARDNDTLISDIFTALEKRTIEEYYHGRYGKSESEERKSGKKSKHKKGLPPGLAKRDSLPPGLEKQLQRNGHLPPGLEKRELPDGLSRLLPKRQPGYERVVVDNDVLLIETATGLIMDILADVF
ncbi:hypothetical protein [Sedimenticola sp.]|uniref:hypothetical protein n=1 Tax=Sedimenticola sp. TaxID=1940285 RepID=UPI003D0C06E1